MSQNDFSVANASGATVRGDINSALQALATLSSGSSAPSTTYAYQLWADTTAGLLKQRNAANTAWEVRGTLAETMNVARSSNTIIGAGDFGKTFSCTSTFTQTFDAVATLGDGFMCWFRNSGTGIITLDPNGSETIDGATTIELWPGEGCAVFCTGSAFLTAGRAPAQLQWGSFKNLLINPDFRIDQRNAGASVAIADDTYAFDRWYGLSQTASVNHSQQTGQEDASPWNLRITQNQAAAQRFGLAQVVEARNCKHLRGKQVALAPRIRCSSSQAIRYAILEWTGTEDTVTSDVVNDWTSGTYTAGNFFLGSNLTVTAVGSLTPSAAAWTTLPALIGTLGSSFNNLIVLVWTEGTAAQNVTLDFGYVQLERGAVGSEFERRSFEVELAFARRYYQKSFPVGTAPAQNAGLVGAHVFPQPVGASGSTAVVGLRLSPEMRASPTVVTYNPQAANAQIRTDGVADWSSTATYGLGSNGFGFIGNTPGGSAQGQGCAVHWSAEAEL